MDDLRLKILLWIEERISSSPDFVIPIRSIREELVKGLTVPVPPIEEIESWLEEDDRFDLLESPAARDDLPSEQSAALEQMGLFTGPRVGLKSKRPSQEEILKRLEEHSNRLLAAVQKGYAAGEIEEESFARLEDNLADFIRKVQTT